MNKSLLIKILSFSIAIFGIAVLYDVVSIHSGIETNAGPVNKSGSVTIRFMSNLPDRQTGQGKIEQMIADEYMKENPEVKIRFETYQDVAFQQKFKVYVSLDDVPDIYMNWSGPQFDLAQKVSEEINLKEFKDYGFNPGALETRKKNGKLYGLPKDNDMYFLYYNKAIFNKYNIKVPRSFNEMLETSKKLNKLGIIPCATNGKDKWEFTGIYTDIYYKINPDPLKHVWNWDNAAFSKDPDALQTMRYYRQLMDVDFFQSDFAETDYASAKSLFTSGKAAMYYMGTWELSMALENSLPKEFRKNLDVMTFPPIEGEINTGSVMTKWYGGGFSISKNSLVKKQSLEFLKYFFKREKWAQMVWDYGVSIPAQTIKPRSNDSKLMQSVYDILVKSDKYKGNYPLTKQADAFVTPSQGLLREFCLGLMTPQEYLQRLDQGITKCINKGK